MPHRKRAVVGRSPVRLVARLVIEFLVGATGDARRAFNGDLTQALLIMAIAHANVAHLTYDPTVAQSFPPDGAPPDEERRPVTVQAVAAALRLPYATAHRHIKQLVADGYCVRLGRAGLIIPVSVLRTPVMQTGMEAIERRFIDMITTMKRQGVILPVAANTTEPPTRHAVRRIEVDFLLSILEMSLGRVERDVIQLVLMAALLALNLRPITDDPELTWRYAFMETPPPGDLYRPVSVRRIAEELGVPYETARQCMSRLVDAGMVERVPGGLVNRIEWNLDPLQDEVRHVMMGRFIRAMLALARIGVDFKDLPTEPLRTP